MRSPSPLEEASLGWGGFPPFAASYLKTVLIAVAAVFGASGVQAAMMHWLAPALLLPLGLLTGAVAAAGLTLAFAGSIVLYRCHRDARGEPDLFLKLNASRAPRAIERAASPNRSRLRRWLARRTLGHDLVVGDVVAVKSWPEIQLTLDASGRLDGLPFMPEMRDLCGRRFRVFRGMHRLFDHRKTRGMRYMPGAVLLLGAVCDGGCHGGCSAACHMIWKSAWLERLEPDDDIRPRASTGALAPVTELVQLSTKADGRYTCQLTELHASSQRLAPFDVVDRLRPLIAGNVTVSAFIVGWLTHFFVTFQYRRGAVPYPCLGAVKPENRPADPGSFKPGDQVVVRSPSAIWSTLNDALMHRGMWFEPDMMKFCNQPCVVQSEVRDLIDIVSGEMLTMKTPAYILRDVHFSGERQLFNAQWEPLFWRSVWLEPTVRQTDSAHVPIQGVAASSASLPAGAPGNARLPA